MAKTSFYFLKRVRKKGADKSLYISANSFANLAVLLVLDNVVFRENLIFFIIVGYFKYSFVLAQVTNYLIDIDYAFG